MTGPPAPDFLIVGAPKCGTSSLNAYLAEHPSIVMGPKEQHFFGSDLDALWSPPILTTRPTEEQYLAGFASAPAGALRGEASVWYLWSRRAPKEIFDYNPTARIIVMLRNPIEALLSLHSQYLYNGIENLDFVAALAAEADRKRGLRIPPNNGPWPWRLFYRDVMRFDEQLLRYFETFGRAQVHIVLFDDLVADARATFRRVLAFLDVDEEFEPAFEVANANRRIRSRRLRQTVWQLSDPSSTVRRMGERVIPLPTVRSAMLRRAVPMLRRLNTTVQARQPLPPRVHRELAAELAPGIRRLGDLIGRDLGHWYSAPGS